MKINPFERFTKEARIALQIAESESNWFNKKFIWTEHLLLGILSVSNCIACSILNNMWINFDSAKSALLDFWSSGDAIILENTKISVYLSAVIENSLQLAAEYKHTFISCEHLLYCIVTNKQCWANLLLNSLQVETDTIKDHIKWFFEKFNWNMGNHSMNSSNIPKSFEDLLNNVAWVVIWAAWHNWQNKPLFEMPHNEKSYKSKSKSKTPTLDYFSKDLTAQAKAWKLDPVIWRDAEISRVMHTLNRKTKNNPVLLWEAWVWKTAIAEWLAQRINDSSVPIWLLNKRILSLDLWDVIAGTKYRWEFEERMKDIIAEAVSEESNVVLFIDELHTIIWLWASEWTLDTANILKPALARGSLQVIWATTLDEYRKHIEKDKALDRRFQKIIVEEPTEDQSIEILNWLRWVFEKFHNVEITSWAIIRAVKLSKRYLPEKFLPDKAIDLIDEAAARKWWKAVIQTKEKERIERNLADNLKLKEKAVQSQDYEKALFLKNKDEELRKELSTILNPKIDGFIGKVDETDIQLVLSDITWISSLKIWKSETQKIKDLWNILNGVIIWQSSSIEKICKCIIRQRAWIWEENRPIWSFLILWPTWVWKTETVKALAQSLYETKDALIKIDMSEFWEKHNVSRLLWTTAGYVWYDEWWQLTESVRRRPYAIVLFDEIEKAHSDCFNILLQIMEDGYLTDGKWRKVDFRNTVIVLTSNIWAEILTEEAWAIWFETEEKRNQTDAIKWFEHRKEQVMEEVKDFFLPELLNRIDSIIIYNPLDKKTIAQIVKKQLNELNTRLLHKSWGLEITTSLVNGLTDIAYNPREWARKVRKVITEHLEEPISELIINWKIKQDSVIKAKQNKNWSFEIKF